MSQKINLDNLQRLAKQLHELLEAREVGLSTWHEAVLQTLQEIREEIG